MSMSLKRKFRKFLQTLIILVLIAPFYSLADFEISQVQAADNELFTTKIKTDSRGGTLQNVYVKVQRETTGVGFRKYLKLKVYPNDSNPPTSPAIFETTYWSNNTLYKMTSANLTCSDGPGECIYQTGYLNIPINGLTLNPSQKYLIKVEVIPAPASTTTKVGNLQILDAEPAIVTAINLRANPSYETINLEWDETAGVAEFEIYKGETLLSKTSDLSFQVNGLTPGTKHNFSIIAVDYIGNKSQPVAIEVTTLPKPATPKFSLDANNINEAYDKNINTSGNILSNNGYIIFKLSDLGLLPGSMGSITAGLSDEGNHSFDVEYLDKYFQTKGSGETIAASGFKEEYPLNVHADALYVKVKGTLGASVYIYDIGAPSGENPPKSSSGLVRGVSNYEDSFDGKDNTSGNIMTDNGYITFKFDTTTKLEAGKKSTFTIGTNRGENYDLKVEYLSANNESLGTPTNLKISGFKNEYSITMHVNASYIRFHGITNIEIYFYELTKTVSEGGGTGDIGVSNFEHAYDGNTNTSGNIMTHNGFITFKLTDVGLWNAAESTLTIGTSNGETHNLKIEFLNSNKFVRATTNVTVSGFKNEYPIPFNVGASYIRIHALPTAKVYIYELTKPESGDSGPIISDPPDSGVSNYEHSFDGQDNTSGNIMTDNGYISFKLGEHGLTAGQESTFIIGTHNGENHTLSVDFLDSNKVVIANSAITVPVSGFKNDYKINMRSGAVYMRIHGLKDVKIYIYEVAKTTGNTPEAPSTPNGPVMSDKANNLTEAYDDKDTTSANILEGNGFIIYKLADLGLSPISISKYIIGTTGEGSHQVRLEYLDSELKVVGAPVYMNISGFKNESETTIPADVTHVKINGISGTILTIYEILSD